MADDAVIAAVTDLAHAFGFSVAAEGVETERQDEAVRAVGCEFAQGFFYARPMSAAGISALLAAGPAKPLRLPEPLHALTIAL